MLIESTTNSNVQLSLNSTIFVYFVYYVPKDSLLLNDNELSENTRIYMFLKRVGYLECVSNNEWNETCFVGRRI